MIPVLMGTCLLLLALITRRITGQNTHPAVVFPGVWGITISLTEAAKPFGFYTIEPEAIPIILSGCVAFIAGSFIGERVGNTIAPRKFLSNIHSVDFRKVITISIVLHAVILPLWVNEIIRIADGSTDLLVIAYQLRAKSVTGEDTLGPITGNYLVLGLIITPVLTLGAIHKQISALSATLVSMPWIVTNILTNGRAGLIGLLLALVYLRAAHSERISPRTMLYGAAVFLIVVGLGVVLVNKGGFDSGALLQSADSLPMLYEAAVDIATIVTKNLLDYGLQGPILLSRYLSGAISIESTWDALAFPCSVLEKFSLCKSASQHQEFSEFGTDDQIGNVYSIYFAIFPKYGWAGLLIIPLLYGMWAAYHHRSYLKSHSFLHGIMAGYLFSFTVLSIFADAFGTSPNFLIKLAIICGLLQKFCILRGPCRRTDTRRKRAEHEIPLEAIRR